MSYVMDGILLCGFICVTIGVYVLAGLGWSLICAGCALLSISYMIAKSGADG